MNIPKATTIIETIDEAKDTKTIKFNYSKSTKPGQFFMIWIPKVDEIPMSVSYINKDIKGITFRKIGEATNKLYEMKKGDKIGVRGPYGNGFKLNGKKILFVGGGTGIATLAPIVEQAQQRNIPSTVILGVKNNKELFFEKRLRTNNSEVYVTTDDGSKGYKGFASDLANNLLQQEKFTSIITCGPEIMMKKLLEISNNIPVQASLERYMKCGIGICGQCCVGDGLRVCVEGPVINGKTLKNVEDFGIYKRDAAGGKIFF
jgi:dihydroorotate dehydrogenase electron transfer subunit